MSEIKEEPEELAIKSYSGIRFYPNDFIPEGAALIIGVDEGSPDGDCTVKGFYKDGTYHIQEVDHS